MVAHRLINDSPAPGAWNMAVDEALLIDAAENGVATLRFYEWNEPTLSLGCFQRYDDRQHHAASRECAIVRRQTGGGAILHDRELTYSLALPAAHPLARKNEKLYTVVHEAFIAALTPALATPDTGWVLARRNKESSLAPNAEPFLCFERRAAGDVLLIPKSDRDETIPDSIRPKPAGSKILGSAQRRHRGAILQHGSLLLESSPAAPELPGIRDLTGRPIAIREFSGTVASRLKNALDMSLVRSPLSLALESKARELANIKYGSPAWTNRR